MMTDEASMEAMPLRIARIADVAEGTRSFELVRADGAELPAFTAGAHVSVRVPNGEWRKYSLCGDPAERGRYVIAVKREAGGRGGSVSLVDQAREGDILPVSPPDNAFELVEPAAGYIFIAGGIGITPILSMIRAIETSGSATPWKLYYLSQSAQACAFRNVLGAPQYAGRVVMHHDGGDPARSFDLWPVLEKPSSFHVYCCGPKGLMESVRDMTGHWSHSHVHFESFSAGGTAQAGDRPFTVVLAKSGDRHEIPVGRSILGVLRDHGCQVPFSCESGTCGSCRTTLVSGQADHRDMVLMPHEMDSQIMVCVSRARSAELVLDL